MVKDENVTIPFRNVRSHNSLDYIPFMKDMNMDELKASPTVQGEDNTLKRNLNAEEKSRINECDDLQASKFDSVDVPACKISKKLGCNYEEDLKNDLRSNTDQIGGTKNEFYFETDHEALRGNPDYLCVLKTMAILEAQKVQAVKDLEKLNDARNAAVKDPLSLISRLQKGEDLGLPGKQKISQLPHINWDRYGLASLSQHAGYSIRKPETRKNVSNLINHVGKYLLGSVFYSHPNGCAA